MRRESLAVPLGSPFFQRISSQWHRNSSREFTAVIGFLFFIVAVPKFHSALNLNSVVSLIGSYLFLLRFETGLLGSLVLASSYFQDADECLEKERNSISAERDAFREFMTQVQSIQTGSGPPDGMMATHMNTGYSGRQLQEVRDQYQEIILSLPDYERTYDETFEEHITAEFGTDVASLVLDGQRFDHQLKQSLIQQARGSAQQREQLLRALAVEEDSIQEAKKQLRPVVSTLETLRSSSFQEDCFDNLVEADENLQNQLNACESVLETRQQDIRAVDGQIGGTADELFQEYLYDPLEVTFPVLHATLDYIQRIDQRRSTLISALSKWRGSDKN